MGTVPGWPGVLLIAIVPVVVLRRAGAGWKWFALGILSWMIGVGVKAIVTSLLHHLFLDTWPLSAQAVVDGAVSALTELAAAACFLWKAKLRWVDALAFGAGIGAFEALFVLAVGYLEVLETKPVPPDPLYFIDAFFLIERVVALVGHTASRLLIYVAVLKKWLWPALICFVLFSIIDGAASYGIGAEWDWENATVMSRFLGLVGVVGLIEVGAAWWFVRRADKSDLKYQAP